VSVIVPVFNCETTLERCLQSIVNQSYTYLQIIIVDDGSTDSSSEIYEKYAKLDARIRIEKKENGGVSEARNTGIDIADGKYIAFVDADDYLDETYIEELLNLNEKARDIVLYISQVNGFYERNATNVYDLWNRNVDKEYNVADMYYIWRYSLWNPCWNKLYLTEIIKENNVRFQKNLKLGEDLLFNNKYLEVFNPQSFYVKSGAKYNYLMPQNEYKHSNEDDFYTLNKKQISETKNIFCKFGMRDTEEWLMNKDLLELAMVEVRRNLLRNTNESYILAKTICKEENIKTLVKKYKSSINKRWLYLYGICPLRITKYVELYLNSRSKGRKDETTN